MKEVSIKDLSRLSSKALLEVYNSHASKPITRFADYPSALRRTRELMKSLQGKSPEKIVAAPINKKAKSKVLVSNASTPSLAKQYHSVRAAFIALELPLSKHQRFRRQLKLEGKATFANYLFVATY